ncbi:MAG: biotin-dependent carboxyltransferase family protein [Caldimonas sp.]
MSIEVIKPGLATTVQDAGRPGYYHLGIPQSGALDQYAFRLANLLVGNDEGAAAIECTLLAPELEFRRDAIVAVTGAELDVRVAGQPVACNTSFKIAAGQTLAFGFMKSGARAYVAVTGGIDVPLVLGSRSTYGLGAFGGFQGRKLQAGDVLPVGTPTRPVVAGRTVAAEFVSPTPKALELRVLPGLYFHRLEDASAATFFGDTWSVAPEADRIGYRYRGGAALQFRERRQPFGAGSDPSNIVDAGYPYGSIQVPGGTEPIILHRDAVSGGGYAMVGTVISADMDRIAQMQPNYKARFVRVDMAQALAARASYRTHLDRLRVELTPS